ENPSPYILLRLNTLSFLSTEVASFIVNIYFIKSQNDSVFKVFKKRIKIEENQRLVSKKNSFHL
ncbi:hypothetical protein DLM75_23925, partial [Leptospira stimsonii]